MTSVLNRLTTGWTALVGSNPAPAVRMPLAPAPKPKAVCPDPANQLFFVIALPKSAGQAMRAMLNRCRAAGPQRDFIPDALSCPGNQHVEMPLTDRVLADFPVGGWFHTHAPATLMSMDFLHRHRIRHIIQFRHPLDQVVAYHCHLVKHRRLDHSTTTSWQPALALTNPLAPVPAEAFHEGTTTERSLDLLLDHGYFAAVLDWIGQWCAFRSPELSLVVPYEDLVADPPATLNRAVDFLRPMLAVPPTGIASAVGEMDAYVKYSRKMESGIEPAYPQGYTGRVGAFRDYLAPRQIERAESRYEQYCRESVYGPQLRERYPRLAS